MRAMAIVGGLPGNFVPAAELGKLGQEGPWNGEAKAHVTAFEVFRGRRSLFQTSFSHQVIHCRTALAPLAAGFIFLAIFRSTVAAHIYGIAALL